MCAGMAMRIVAAPECTCGKTLVEVIVRRHEKIVADSVFLTGSV